MNFNRDASNPEVLAAAAQAFFETDARPPDGSCAVWLLLLGLRGRSRKGLRLTTTGRQGAPHQKDQS